MQNQDIANIFHEIADILEMQDENRFRIRSYRNAAIAIENLSEDIDDIYKKGALKDVSSVGVSIAEKIEELIKTGKCGFHQELLAKIPHGVVDIMRVPGMGPKHAMLVYKELGVNNINRLRRAAEAGKLEALPRFGKKLEEKILKGIEQLSASEGKFKLITAYSYAESIVRQLSRVKAVQKIELAGSVRRKKELVGDIDIRVISEEPQKVMDAFVKIDGIKEVLAKGKTKSSAVLNCGLQVDVRVLEDKSFGAALYYFTGSKEHNVAVRDMAKHMGLKVNEYGIFRGEKNIASRAEEDIFKALGLSYIEPELRENSGEIQAAKKNELPYLLEEKDLKGDFHSHTNESDGKNTIQEMAEAAINKGYGYLALTDHSKAVTVAHGKDEKELLKHFERIDKVNKTLKGFRVLKGVEVDIKSDGTLDLEDWFLKECDVVIAAVHSKFTLPKDEMTQRIVKAIQNKNVDIVAHLTGRLLKEREPYALDVEEILKAAKEFNVAMELNSYPDRLDLNDVHCKLAKDMGVKIAVGTDSHSAIQLDNARWGIYTARRGWLEKADVLNTLPVEKILKIFKKT
jgi:DNA polymerase (family 10)